MPISIANGTVRAGFFTSPPGTSAASTPAKSEQEPNAAAREDVDERSSYDAMRALGELRSREELPGYRSAAHSVEAVLAGHWERD